MFTIYIEKINIIGDATQLPKHKTDRTPCLAILHAKRLRTARSTDCMLSPATVKVTTD